MAVVREIWEQGPSLRTSILRHWLVVALTTAALGGVVFAATAAQEPEYEAVAELTFSQVDVRTLDPDEPTSGDPVRRMNNRISQIESVRVLERAAELLDGSFDPAALQARIEVWGEPEETDTAWIEARDADPDDAAAIANAVAEAYQDVRAEQERDQIQQAVAELDEAVARMEARIEEFADLEEGQPGLATPASVQRSVAIAQVMELASRRERLVAAAAETDAAVASFQPASPPWEPAAPRPRLAGALAAFLGLALASAWAYWWEGRGLARSPAEVRARLGLPLLAELPRVRNRHWPSPLTSRRARHHVPPPYEFVALALDRTLSEQAIGSVIFATARARRGDAAVALDTALALCQERRRVYLVDANMRDRKLTRMWHMSGSLGLTNLTNPGISLQQVRALTSVAGGEGSWAFVPAGSRELDPPRLQAPVLERLLDDIHPESLAADSVRVVLHGPPVLEVADVGAAAHLVDGVVLEVFARTKLEDVQRAAETIQMAGGRVLGFVFIRGRSRKGHGPLPSDSGRHRAAPSRPQATPVS